MILLLTSIFLLFLATAVLSFAYKLQNPQFVRRFWSKYYFWYTGEIASELMLNMMQKSSRRTYLIFYFLGIMILIAGIIILILV